MIFITILATLLALVQNSALMMSGMLELAIASFPLHFTGFFIVETLLIWAGYFFSRRKKNALPFTLWVLVILGLTETLLPISTFSAYIEQTRRHSVLDKIELANTSAEILTSDKPGNRFALTYTLRFPQTRNYLTYPAVLERSGKPQLFGSYFTKEHPEYYKDEFTFTTGTDYTFTVVFDAGTGDFDAAQSQVVIDICDGRDYSMACRTIPIKLDAVTAALAAHPTPTRHEPGIAADNPEAIKRDNAEKSIRLTDLHLSPAPIKPRQPVEFSFAITNIGDSAVDVPEQNFANLVHISYGWEPVTDEAKKTNIIPGIVRFGDVIAAGGAQFSYRKDGKIEFVRKDKVAPGEKVVIEDKIEAPGQPFDGPFVPGNYKLHIYVYSVFSTEHKPVQELTQDFTVVP